ncbi:unnamed protein product [Alternaria alternata]
MVPSSRNMQQDNMESRSQQTSERYHYQRYGQSQATAAPPPQVEEVAVPVMLCHTCSHCGQMRSAGFHRSNPVLPGKPMVPTLCRRCEKKLKSSYRSTSRYTHIRKCTADVPCEWPGECVHIDIEHDERRGRLTEAPHAERVPGSSSSVRPLRLRRDPRESCIGLSRKNAGLGVKVDLPFESAFVLRGGARKRKLALYLIQGRTGRSFESVVVL